MIYEDNRTKSNIKMQERKMKYKIQNSALEKHLKEVKISKPKDYSHILKKRTCLDLFRLSAAVMGIELAYSAETAFVSPILLELGMEHQKMTLVWALSPILGFFLSPLLGSLSDRCRFKLGRRRPLIILLSLGLLIGLFFVPFGKDLGLLMGDQMDAYKNSSAFLELYQLKRLDVRNNSIEEKLTLIEDNHLPVKAVVVTILGIVLMDFNADVCQGPVRAYLLDISLPEDHTRGLSSFTVMAGIGGFLGYAIGGVDWDKMIIGSWLGGNVKTVFLIVTIIFIICVIITVTSFREVPLKMLQQNIKMNPPSILKTNDIKTISIKERSINIVIISDEVKKHVKECDDVRKNTTKENDDMKKLTKKAVKNCEKPSKDCNNTKKPTQEPVNNSDVVKKPEKEFDDMKKPAKECDDLKIYSKEAVKDCDDMKKPAKDFDDKTKSPRDTDEMKIHFKEFEDTEKPSRVSLWQYLKTVVLMPRCMKILYLNNLLNWMSHLSYTLYFTDFVGESVYGGDPGAPVDSPELTLYNEGVRFGCWGLAVYSISCAGYSFIIEWLIKKFRAKSVVVGGFVLYGASMCLMAHLRSPWASLLLSVPAGVAYATLITVPYIMVAHYHTHNIFESADTPQVRGLGTDIAVIGSTVFVAQLSLSLGLSWAAHWLGGATSAMWASGALAGLAAITATYITYLDL